MPRSTSDDSRRAGGIETGLGDLLRQLRAPEYADAVAPTHLSNGTSWTGLPHLIEEGQGGFLVEPGDVSALADRLRALYDDPELRKAMGRFNRRRAVERFSVKAQVDALIDIYRSLVQGPHR